MPAQGEVAVRVIELGEISALRKLPMSDLVRVNKVIPPINASRLISEDEFQAALRSTNTVERLADGRLQVTPTSNNGLEFSVVGGIKHFFQARDHLRTITSCRAARHRSRRPT